MELNKLKELMSKFYQTKSIADAYKKDCDKMNKEIKSEMTNQDLTEVELEDVGVTCQLQTQKRKSFDEPKLINYLKNLDRQIPGAIKTVEVVDEDALENAIYNGLIDANALSPFIKVKEVQVLKFKK